MPRRPRSPRRASARRRPRPVARWTAAVESDPELRAMRERWTRELVEERGAAWVVRHRALLDWQLRYVIDGEPFPDPVLPRP